MQPSGSVGRVTLNAGKPATDTLVELRLLFEPPYWVAAWPLVVKISYEDGTELLFSRH
ncbi:hypothetical protein GCM10027047_35430 [Rhodococcus aerolatus]